MCEYGDPTHDNNGPLRDYKASVYEGGHRVPFIVKWPQRVKPGSVSDELILAQDWVANMYELTQQDMAEDQAMDSTSLLSLITHKKNDNMPLHPFVLYQAGYAFDGAIRQGDWVLTVDRKNEATELYDLGHDLAQETNLIDRPEHRKLVTQMQAKFLKHNDHSENARDPRTTKAFRVTRRSR